MYKDLEFYGDNLKVVPTRQFEECKAACEEFPNCTFFTVTAVVCVLKGDNVSVKQRTGAISGMTAAACGEAPCRTLKSALLTFYPHVHAEKVLAAKESEKDVSEENEIDDEPIEKFSKTEVNGKFKIMEQWDERLKDPESEEFKSYSETITRGIEEMLAQDETLTEQANFTVTIVGFRFVQKSTGMNP